MCGGECMQDTELMKKCIEDGEGIIADFMGWEKGRVVKMTKKNVQKSRSDPLIVLHPGWITSPSDGDRHYINFHRLARCYGLNPNTGSCLNWGDTKDRVWLHTSPYARHAIHLYPREKGDYLPHLKKWIGDSDEP